MASVFPGALDLLATNKANATAHLNDHPAHHNDIADAINALERTHGAEKFSVLNEGAVGNGAADDTAAIQAAIDAAEAYTIASGRHADVVFPAGVYKYSATLRVAADNVNLCGIGRRGLGMGAIGTEATSPVTGGSILLPAATFTGDWLIDISRNGAPGTVRALVGNWINGLSIDSFYLQPGTIEGGVFFQVFKGGILNSFFARLDQNGAAGSWVEFRCVDDINDWPRGVWDCLFWGNNFQDSAGPVFYAPGQASDSIVANNIIQGSATHGVHIVGPGWIVQGNYIVGNGGRGLKFESRQMIINGNRFRENVGGIEGIPGLTGGDFAIVGNLFRNCSQGGDNTNDGILIAPIATSPGGLISGNQFSTMNDGGALKMRYGINIANANAVGVTIGPNGEGYENAVGATFGTAAINDAGTSTRIVTGKKIRVLTTDATTADITAEGTANTSSAQLTTLGKTGAGVVVGAKTEARSDGRVHIGSTSAHPVDLLQGNLTRFTINTSGDLVPAEGRNFAFGTTTGSKIGTATSQKIGFFNATPIVQPANTTDLRQAVIDLGLLASGGATPLNTNGGPITVAPAAGTTALTIGGVNAVTSYDHALFSATMSIPGSGVMYTQRNVMTGKGLVTVSQRGAALGLLAADHTTVADRTITNMVRSGETITVTATSHGFATGDRAVIYGVTHSFNIEVNMVSYSISNVLTNSFDINVPGLASGTYTSGGTATTRPMLTGLIVHVSPKVARGGLTGAVVNADDLAGVTVSNVSPVSTAKATDAFYIADNPLITDQAWGVGYNSQAKLDTAFRAGGTIYSVAFDAYFAAYNGAAVPIRIPNNKYMVGRNVADDGNQNMFKVNTNNEIEVGGTLQMAGSIIEFLERADPAAPSTNEVRLYAKDNGAGKTQLVARFATGAVQQVAIEP